jgi:hypothetical protein
VDAPPNGWVAASDEAPLVADVGSHDQPTRTAKKRLGVKASDEQRVDKLQGAIRTAWSQTAAGRMWRRRKHEDPQMTMERECEHLAQVNQL